MTANKGLNKLFSDVQRFFFLSHNVNAVWKTIRYLWIQKSFDCFLKCDVHCKENLNTPRYYHTTAACHRKGKLASLLIACDLSMAYLLSCFVPVCVGLTYIWMSLEMDWIPYGKKGTQTSFKTCFKKKEPVIPPNISPSILYTTVRAVAQTKEQQICNEMGKNEMWGWLFMCAEHFHREQVLIGHVLLLCSCDVKPLQASFLH